ncbi:N-6 DNA methylase [Listeria booriae]|uniref:N-6 DNA methylase n=1 Tax=Listeria booriae TaxID=1552123 RepID=UPI0016257660|nr:N-6 DNA methylase [Listeria booriae]MBC2319213.1 N-6 DNA methylase [Listeria booriae]
MGNISETETVIKRILPYLERRGYNIEKDMKFEEMAELDTEKRKGFIDIMINCGKRNPLFLIEAKRDGTKITANHRKQAIDYGKSKKCLFVAITNGQDFELLNVSTGIQLKLNDTAYNKIPSRDELIKKVIPELKKDSKTSNIYINNDRSLPYRPGVPLTKLNRLIQQCHNTIRKIEKSEETAFADFSKILFLKLLEEKWDLEESKAPYSYVFHELASTGKDNADRVMNAIKSMLTTIASMPKYGEVLAEPVHLKQPQTYLAIVKLVSSISWNDCDLDSKGTAFEYFVRATLRGKKLGQYFTPRPLVKMMLTLGKYKQINSTLKSGQPFKVLDPACGTGGFLVQALGQSFSDLNKEYKNGEIHENVYETISKKLKEDTFFGIDANDAVASTAKMNMIIAGDGHNNIRAQDSLKTDFMIPQYEYFDQISNALKKNDDGKAHLILSNPPFGTSEGESLTTEDLNKYPIVSKKGQSLFIQKMILSCADDSRIVTVIDEGVLNTSTYSDLREYILKNCRIEYIISAPETTFKPNKINVKTSILVLKKRKSVDIDNLLEDQYPINFVKVESFGYDGAGNEARGFDLEKLINEIDLMDPYNYTLFETISGYNWKGNVVDSGNIYKDISFRLDYKYWEGEVLQKLNKMQVNSNCFSIKQLNMIETKRGSSPNSSEYVSKDEGYALVVKAGTNVSKNGRLLIEGDYIEEHVYIEYKDKGKEIIQDGDILLSSTGEGTLGKCCVYRNYDEHGNIKPAIADGHVTLIRVDTEKVYPEYLCDYLRKGFGSKQIQRLFTGSTGLIELQPIEVDNILMTELPDLQRQMELSRLLREAEDFASETISNTLETLSEEENSFFSETANKF